MFPGSSVQLKDSIRDNEQHFMDYCIYFNSSNTHPQQCYIEM